MKPEDLDRTLLKIIYLDAAVIVAAQTLGCNALVSGLFTLTFPLTVVLWLRAVREKLGILELLTLLTLGLAAGSVLLDGLLSGAAVNPAYGRKLVMFCMTILFFGAVYRLEGSGNRRGWARQVLNLLVVWLPDMYDLGGAV